MENEHALDVREPYFDLIKNEVKTVEGRAGLVDTDLNIHEDYKDKKSKYKKGDTLRFTRAHRGEGDNNKEVITCRITDVLYFDTFEEMLVSCGLHQCLPNIDTVEEGVKVYRSFPGYEQREKDFGVVGIQLKVENSVS